MNRFIWDMRYPKVSPIPGLPPVVINPIAKPGTYQVQLTVDGQTQTQSFELKLNPNETYTRAETDAKADAWLALYSKAEEGVQAVLRARAASQKATEAAAANDRLKDPAAAVKALCDEFESSMVATGKTLVQIISEPSKPLAKLTMLHNIMEHTEGPPNQPWQQVYAKIAAEMDDKIAEFNRQLKTALQPFED